VCKTTGWITTRSTGGKCCFSSPTPKRSVRPGNRACRIKMLASPRAAFELTERAASRVSKTNTTRRRRRRRRPPPRPHEVLHMNCHINNAALVFKWFCRAAKERLSAARRPTRGAAFKVYENIWILKRERPRRFIKMIEYRPLGLGILVEDGFRVSVLNQNRDTENISVYLFLLKIKKHTKTLVSGFPKCSCTCLYIFICVCVCVCVFWLQRGVTVSLLAPFLSGDIWHQHTHTHTHTHTNVHTHIQAHTHTHMHTNNNAHTHQHKHTYTHTHTHSSTHTHT